MKKERKKGKEKVLKSFFNFLFNKFKKKKKKKRKGEGKKKV